MIAGDASMILTCPACATRYRVAGQEFEGAAGRTVRCANCGHVWFETASAQPARKDHDLGTLTSFGSQRAQAAPDTAPQPVPRLEIPPQSQPAPSRNRRRGRAVATRLVGMVTLLLAVVAAGVFVLRQHKAIWPSAAWLYASTGQSAAPSGAGLVIRKIAPSRTAEGLTIVGEIANLGSTPSDVPRLRVVLQDATEKEIRSETIAPPETRLQPGESVKFEASFAHPPDAATGVVVKFAPS